MRIKEGCFILREIVGTAIAMPIGEMANRINGAIELTKSGALLWKKLENECSETELVEELLSNFDVDEETARNDVAAFVDSLRAQGFLEG